MDGMRAAMFPNRRSAGRDKKMAEALHDVIRYKAIDIEPTAIKWQAARAGLIVRGLGHLHLVNDYLPWSRSLDTASIKIGELRSQA